MRDECKCRLIWEQKTEIVSGKQLMRRKDDDSLRWRQGTVRTGPVGFWQMKGFCSLG